MKYLFRVIWIIICFLTYLEFFIVGNLLSLLWDFKPIEDWSFKIKDTEDKECVEVVIVANVINFILWLICLAFF